MTAETLREWLQKLPFHAFRIRTSDGESYEIRHPEMAFLTRAELVVGLAERKGIPARYRSVSLLHVTVVEPLDSPAAA